MRAASASQDNTNCLDNIRCHCVQLQILVFPEQFCLSFFSSFMFAIQKSKPSSDVIKRKVHISLPGLLELIHLCAHITGDQGDTAQVWH